MILFCVHFFNTFAHVVACAFVVFIMSSPTLLGSVGEFDPSSETFTAYFERLEQFFEANSIGHYPADATAAVIQAANRKKVAVMISVIGKNTYGTLVIYAVQRTRKIKRLMRYAIYCSDILSPSDWKLRNRIDFTVVFKKKTKVFLITAPVLDIWLPRVILVNS